VTLSKHQELEVIQNVLYMLIVEFVDKQEKGMIDGKVKYHLGEQIII